MPTIPAPKTQSVLPEGQLPYQSVQTSPDSFGAQLGSGLTQAGNAAVEITQANQTIKNQTDNTNALNGLMQQEQDLRNGNKERGITGYSTLLGQNAIDAIPEYQQKLQDSYKEIRATLNPAAQREFDFTAMRILRGGFDAMGSHAAQQQRVANANAFKSALELKQQAALNDADDPEKWKAHLGEVQDASNQASIAAGQYGDQAEIARRAALSTVFEGRVKQLMNRDPIAAATFYHDNIGAIEPNKRYALEHELKVTTDNVYAHGDGGQAYKEALGQPTAPTMPANKQAPDLKPYDQALIDSRKKLVMAKTPWDAEIAAAAKQYNVNPWEIRIKMAVEAGNDPKAVNPKSGATGLGQFMPDTAARFGVTDRTDPVQSINGIAKMLAANGGTTGADMSRADRAYYGGNPNAKGPNTDQYVENTRALRQQLMGGGAPAPLTTAQLEGKETDVISRAEALADQRQPGNPAYRDKVVSVARSMWAKDVQALRNQDYATTDRVLQAVIQTKATSFGDLPPSVQQDVAKLTPKNYLGIQTQLERNLRESNGEFTKSNPALVNSLRQRIYLPDGDPQKITNPGQLTEFMAHGLNYADGEHLRKEITEANTPEGNPFLKQVNQVKQTAHKMLTSNMSAFAIQHPELAEEAAYRFARDLDNKIKAARANKVDPQSMFNPTSPDYVLNPAKVSAFMPTPNQVAAAQANQKPPAAPGALAAAPRLPNETPADYLRRIGQVAQR